MPSFISVEAPCMNCGQTHPTVPGKHSATCVFIGARTHGSGSDIQIAAERLQTQAYTTIPIPSSFTGKAELFDQIWSFFEDIKDENEQLRDHLSRSRSRKGSLRTDAPLIWLRWRSSDGRRGQTRNEKNYQDLWRGLVQVPSGRDGRMIDVAWLTLSPLNATPESPEPQKAFLSRPSTASTTSVNSSNWNASQLAVLSFS